MLTWITKFIMGSVQKYFLIEVLVGLSSLLSISKAQPLGLTYYSEESYQEAASDGQYTTSGDLALSVAYADRSALSVISDSSQQPILYQTPSGTDWWISPPLSDKDIWTPLASTIGNDNSLIVRVYNGVPDTVAIVENPNTENLWFIESIWDNGLAYFIANYEDTLTNFFRSDLLQFDTATLSMTRSNLNPWFGEFHVFQIVPTAMGYSIIGRYTDSNQVFHSNVFLFVDEEFEPYNFLPLADFSIPSDTAFNLVYTALLPNSRISPINDTLQAVTGTAMIDYVSIDTVMFLNQPTLSLYRVGDTTFSKTLVLSDYEMGASTFSPPIVTAAGHVVVAYTLNTPPSFGSFSTLDSRVVVHCFDADLNTLWQRTYFEGDYFYDKATSLLAHPDGGFTVVGSRDNWETERLEMFTLRLDEQGLIAGAPVQKPMQKQKLEIYPNPATDWININAAPGEDYQIRSATGMVISVGKTINTRIDVAHLPVGFYILSVDSQSAEFVVAR